MSQIKEIFIYLLNEGTDVWRPVEAETLDANLYKILPTNYNPDIENWQFVPGDIVECEMKELSNNNFSLVAVRKVSDSIEE